jgi:hypothetical protein
MKEKSYLGNVFESFIVFFILLVILETLFEEYALFMDYSARIRIYLLIAGFGFDLLFSIEFLVRLFLAARRGGAAGYILREGGFIDFVASLPLLVFHSGPLIWMTFFYGEAGFFAALGSLSFLKIVKVIRVARILRFVRALKIFGKLRQKYILTSKYVARVVSLAVLIIVLALIGFAFVERSEVLQSKSGETEKLLANYLEENPAPDFEALLHGSETVLFIEQEAAPVYRRISEGDFKKYYLIDDYKVARIAGYSVYFSRKDLQKTRSFINLLAFSMIIGIIIILSTLYRLSFNRHISGLIMVMLRGFRSAEYSTPVRIARKKMELETYQLAEQYNKKWLPVKRKLLEIKNQNL